MNNKNLLDLTKSLLDSAKLVAIHSGPETEFHFGRVSNAFYKAVNALRYSLVESGYQIETIWSYKLLNSDGLFRIRATSREGVVMDHNSSTSSLKDAKEKVSNLEVAGATYQPSAPEWKFVSLLSREELLKLEPDGSK